MTPYEHFSCRIHESDRYIWYAHSSGYFYKILKSTQKRIDLKGHVKEGDLVIKIGSDKALLAKHLIAKHFYRKYYPGVCIELIDGNPRNISIENMRFYSMRLHGKHTGHLSKSRAVVIKDFKKDPIRYRSVREAAKALYCSYQTLLDYLNGSVRKSVLNKWGRKIYYEVI